MNNRLLALKSKIFELIKFGSSGEVSIYVRKHMRELHFREPVNNMTPLALALALNKGDIALMMMEYEPPYNVKDSYGWTPFHHACSRGHHEVAKQMLKQKEDIVDSNVLTATGNTAMHLAAQEGHLQIVELLIYHGGDPYAKNESRRTPLILALQYSHDDVVEFLEKYKPKEIDYSNQKIFEKIPRPPYNPSYINTNTDIKRKQQMQNQMALNVPPQPDAFFRTVSETNNKNMHPMTNPSSLQTFPNRPPQYFASSSVNSNASTYNNGHFYYPVPNQNSINSTASVHNSGEFYSPDPSIDMNDKRNKMENINQDLSNKTKQNGSRRNSFSKELGQLTGMISMFSDNFTSKPQEGENKGNLSSVENSSSFFFTNNDFNSYSSNNTEIYQKSTQSSYQNDHP